MNHSRNIKCQYKYFLFITIQHSASKFYNQYFLFQIEKVGANDSFPINMYNKCSMPFAAICGLGQAPNSSDTSQCIECPIGEYSDIIGPQGCTVCPNNLTTTFTNTSTLSECLGTD